MSTPPENSPRTRPVSEHPALARRAAELLLTPQTMLPLAADEAAQVVAQMGLIRYAPGALVLREGDRSHPAYLLLLLEGEVQVDMGAVGSGALPLAVLGPGSVIGEMSLLDGAPRSATCIAVGPVLAAGLSRRGLELLIDEHPRAAAKLMTGLAQRLADRLRGMADQLKIYAGMGATPGSGTG